MSRSNPSTPSCMKRSCQRQTAVLLSPVRCMISTVPRPSPLRRTIRARHTCFCRLFRSATTASRRARSKAVLTSTMIPGRMRQTRTQRARRESLAGFKRQILSTSWPGCCGFLGLNALATDGSIGPKQPILCMIILSAPSAIRVAALKARCGTRTTNSSVYCRIKLTMRHGAVPDPPLL